MLDPTTNQKPTLPHSDSESKSDPGPGSVP